MKKKEITIKEGSVFCNQPLDLMFLEVVIILAAVGLIMLLSASFPTAYFEQNNPYYYFQKQGRAIFIGITAMVFVGKLDYHQFKKYSRIMLVISIILLGLVTIPGIGVIRNNARRWISVFGLFTFQPSEIVKLNVILDFAASIASKKDRMKSAKKGVLPYLGILFLIFVFMMAEPHLSGAILICSVGATLMFVGGISWKWIASGIGVILTGAVLLVKGIIPYGQSRIAMWRNPFIDASNEGYQLSQSLITIGSGGLMGVGLGKSRQKYLFLPEVQNDFIFAVVCEELGYIGACVVLGLFMCLILRGYWIALHAKDRYGSLLTVGVVTLLALQVFLNIAVVTGVVPTTGISLPFFSYGGTAIVIQLIELGVVISVSRQMQK